MYREEINFRDEEMKIMESDFKRIQTRLEKQIEKERKTIDDISETTICIHEELYSMKLQERKEKYPHIINHQFMKTTNGNNRMHCFTIDISQLENKSLIPLPMLYIHHGVNETKEITYDLNLSDDDTNEYNNYNNCLGYYKSKGSRLMNTRYDVMIIDNEKNDEETQENNQIEKHEYQLKIPLREIITGSIKQIEIDNKLYTITIPPGLQEYSFFEFDNKVKVIIKYESDNCYKRIGNDLHGYFQYEKQYENMSVKPRYIDGNELSCEIQLINGSDYVIDDYGFYDITTGQKGKYFIHFSLL